MQTGFISQTNIHTYQGPGIHANGPSPELKALLIVEDKLSASIHASLASSLIGSPFKENLQKILKKTIASLRRI